MTSYEEPADGELGLYRVSVTVEREVAAVGPVAALERICEPLRRAFGVEEVGFSAASIKQLPSSVPFEDEHLKDAGKPA